MTQVPGGQLSGREGARKAQISARTNDFSLGPAPFSRR
jgi:hypothetical protein